MIFKNVHGKEVKLKKAWKYYIDWDKKSRSKVQTRAKEYLRQFWDADYVYEEFPVVGTRLTLDFYNQSRQIACEIDGLQHYNFSKFFHSNSRENFLGQLKRDDYKEKFCHINNIQLIRIREDLPIEEQFKDFNL